LRNGRDVGNQNEVPVAVSGTNIVVEGVTGSLTKKMYEGVKSYDGKEGIKFDEESLWWLNQHKEYDDKHPLEAREHVKRLATTPELKERCLEETERSLKYFYRAVKSIDDYY